MEIVVRLCSNDDIARLRSSGHDTRVLRRHEERFALQRAGRAWHLLTWADDRLVGQATVTISSKYEVVRERLGVIPEVNGLAASPQGQGTGRKVLQAAEHLVVDVWNEQDADGNVIAVHHDECDYLAKRIASA